MPKKVWVVHCTAGEYSDTTFSIVGAAATREGAQALALEAATASATDHGATMTPPTHPESDSAMWRVNYGHQRYGIDETDLFDVAPA